LLGEEERLSLLKSLSDVGIHLLVAVETYDLEWTVGPFKVCAFRRLAMEWKRRLIPSTAPKQAPDALSPTKGQSP
jgi:hypothetical protein